MNKQSLLIYNFETLFQIINEIKDNLNFEIFSVTKKEIDNVSQNKFGDFIILTKEDLNINNQILIDNFPYKLNKLIEVINVNFLKNKYNQQSEIFIGKYKLDINSRKISKDNLSLELTEKETEIITFLKNTKEPVKINDLQKKVWEYNPSLETHTVETHIYRLRKKLKETFNDDNFIKSSKLGYSI
tara:strand:- start:110 stop:667 length:558 start_codon:yes stop_codon:yes gene_type:complete